MKYFVLLVLLGAAAYAEDLEKHRRGPKIKVKPYVRAKQGSDVEIRFKVIGKFSI